jgi:Fic family protein
MEEKESAKNAAEIESVQRIEPARVEEVAEIITDVVAELSAAAAKLGHTLHPHTATNLAGIVRIMNTYYSNLIEGHSTRPRDIARALAGDLERSPFRLTIP